ncbi:alpha/beta fold hydrolase [bacterium]|nr:alpha/beta fold hydrolase [bacterium]
MVNRSLYPFKSHFIDVKGFRYHYIDEGTGEPVIMLHGNPTWSFYYRNLAKALRTEYHIIVPDHIGCGLSDKPDEEKYSFTLERRIEDLEQLINHLGFKEKITLILHDWGGMIGMAYAARNPEKISRLVISNTAAFHLPKNKPFPLVLKLCRDFSLSSFLVLRLNAFARGAAKFCCTRKPMASEVRKEYLSPYNNRHNRLALLKFIKDIPLKESDPSYHIVTETQRNLKQFMKVPTLILWGAKDFIFDDHFLAKWKEFLPDATVHRFSDAGHYLLEDAHEEVIPLVRNFLERNPI